MARRTYTLSTTTSSRALAKALEAKLRAELGRPRDHTPSPTMRDRVKWWKEEQ